MNTDYTNITDVFSHNIVCENFATNFYKLAPIFMGCKNSQTWRIWSSLAISCGGMFAFAITSDSRRSSG